MIVGKTSSSISKSEVFSKVSEAQVTNAVFPEVKAIPCVICSPLRQDKKPSFSLYMTSGGHIAWKDFATNDRGSLMDLLCRYWNCSFSKALDKICELSVFKNIEVNIKPKQIKTLTRKESSSQTKIQVTVRPWRDYDYEYWASYGITKPWLKYAEIYPISHKIVTKKVSVDEGSAFINKKYIFPAPKLSFCYVERKEGKLSIKIYSPFSKTHKWCSKMDANVISLWTKVPEYGDKIIIASSVKDALTISCNLHIPAIAPQGEGYNLSDTTTKELKRRYKKVYISFDGDNAGKEDAEKLAKATGFSIISCPILKTPTEDREEVTNLIKEGLEKKANAKDWSDIFLYFGKERFMDEFNKALSYAN